MLRQLAVAPTAFAHYLVGSVFLLTQLALYERTAAPLQPAQP
jgi:hypothetical protein